MKKILILTIISCCLVNYSRTASKYYDGPIIPYNFGFKVAEQQHRHEEKDEKGQIMGEYGFLTADGVYHLTGYGTDENGNYKILFMRNIKVGIPGEPGSQPASQNLNIEQRSETPETTTKIIPVKKPGIELKFKQMIPSNTPSCSNCIITEKEVPETKTPKPPLLPASFIRPDVDSTKKTQKLILQSSNGERKPAVSTGSITKLSSITKKVLTTPLNKTISISKSDEAVGLDVRMKENVPSNGINRDKIRPANQIQPVSVSRGTISPGIKVQANNIAKTIFDTDSQKQISGKPGTKAQKDNIAKVLEDVVRTSGIPTAINANGVDRQVPGISKPTDTSISRPVQTETKIKTSSSSASLIPSGLQGNGKQIIRNHGKLYKFNYTVGYHGHHEEGDDVGVKDGGYYFVGRDGYKRTVNYNANEFGFRPRVKLEQANPQDVPREETEKQAGLKGYEFKWFNI